MKRSKFSLSNYKLFTGDMGKLIPINWFEALPGDSIQQRTSALIRIAPLLAPVMHPVRVRLHHWFVPNRLLWEDWEEFITGGPDGMSNPAVPTKTLTNVTEGSLADYFGIPVGDYTDSDINVSMLPFRAYNLIYNEHYRDQDLIDPLEVSLESGEDSTTVMELKNVSWEKDYFTTARPWTQKGTEVTVPLGDTAPIRKSNDEGPVFDFNDGNTRLTSNDIAPFYQIRREDGQTAPNSAMKWHDPGLEADLSQATGISINDLRLALSIQKYQEARAQYGSRYVEYLRYLGIRSSDARLQNPEYLGGGKQIIQFSEIVQTGPDPLEDGTEVGTLRGHGIAALRSNRYRRFFEEHGVVITMMSVIPKVIYTSTLQRAWSRTVKEDYFQRELQFIGEQEIHNKEIHSLHTNPEGIFGYQARYDEYRTTPSSISGEFHSISNHWHYAREFTGDVALNESFINAVPTKRVNAAQENHVMYVMANHSIQARRQVSPAGKIRLF